MYCGNNRNNRSLLDGTKRLGTPNQCLRIGIGKGRNMPCDVEYEGKYLPIDDFKVYCGNRITLPSGYDKMGSPSDCLKKGIGLGKMQIARNGCGDVEDGGGGDNGDVGDDQSDIYRLRMAGIAPLNRPELAPEGGSTDLGAKGPSSRTRRLRRLELRERREGRGAGIENFNYLFWIIFIIIATLLTVLLVVKTPNFLKKKNNEGDAKEIDIVKITIFILSINIILFFILNFVFRRI